jgi:hypothetical protein
MKKILLLALTVLLISTLSLVGCEELEQAAPVTEELQLVDGIYRGTYDNEVTARFKVIDNKIDSMMLMTLAHKGTNYKDLKEGDPLYPVLQQYNQMLEHLKGMSVSTALVELEKPGDFITDVDGFTGATLRTSKVKSAMHDALNRGVYGPENVADVSVNDKKYADGAYRGYFEGQTTVWFTLENNTFTKLSYRDLAHGGTNYLELKEGDEKYKYLAQQNQILEYLNGKTVADLNDLFTPGDFVDDIDGASGATIRSAKVLSSINDGLNRGPYKPAEGFAGTIGEYEDGRYRGHFAGQVVAQFNVENNTFKKVNFRKLLHMDNDYTKMVEGDELYPVYTQNLQIAEYLEGKPLSAVYDLYTPGEFVDDADGFSGATVRGAKVLSAIMDGLNRGIY